MRRSLVLLATFLILSVPVYAGWDEGVAAFKAKNFERAAHEFQQLVNQTPNEFRGHYMLGLCLEQLNRKEEALHHIRKAYDLNPNDLSIKLALGKAYFNSRRFGDTSKLLASIDPSSVPQAQRSMFYQMRGQAHYRSGNEQGALGDFAQLAKLNPQNAEIQASYGTTALSLGRMDEGLTAMAKATQLAPKDLEKKRTYANALLKKARMSRDKNAKKSAYDTAAKVARDMVAASPTYDNLMLQCSAELGGGQYTEAAATGKTAIAKKGNDWLAHFYVGQAYSSVKKFTEAEGPLKQALQLAKDPNDIKKVWRQLGFIYEKSKQFSESIAAYEKADDQAGVARVTENQETAKYNADVEKENARIAAAKKEAEELEAKLKELEGGGGL